MSASVSKKLETFFSRFTQLAYRKGEVILRAGDPPPGIFYLKQGCVRQYSISPGGETFIIHMFRPGSFFPMTFGINETPNVYYFEAVTPVVTWRAPREKVQEYLNKEPDVLYALTSRLLRGVSGLLQRMEGLVLDSAYEKVASLLLYLARTVGDKDGSDILLPISLTHREVAAWVGTTRETASLQMEALKRKGIIFYKGRRVMVKRIKELEKELWNTKELGRAERLPRH